MYISELQNFRVLPEYENDIMLQMKRDGNYLLVKTYSRNDGSHGRFFVDAEKLSAWIDNNDIPEFWDKNCGNILRIIWDNQRYVFTLEFWWMSSDTSGKISGVKQRVDVTAYDFNQVLVREAWQKILCKQNMHEPVRFVWTESANRTLRKIRERKQMQRALSRAFAQGALNWSDCVITMYADWAEGSFFFHESGGISGGLIMHEHTGKYGNPVYTYSVHT